MWYVGYPLTVLCYLLRLSNISSVHGTFAFPSMSMRKTLAFKNVFKESLKKLLIS